MERREKKKGGGGGKNTHASTKIPVMDSDILIFLLLSAVGVSLSLLRAATFLSSPLQGYRRARQWAAPVQCLATQASLQTGARARRVNSGLGEDSVLSLLANLDKYVASSVIPKAKTSFKSHPPRRMRMRMRRRRHSHWPCLFSRELNVMRFALVD